MKWTEKPCYNCCGSLKSQLKWPELPVDILPGPWSHRKFGTFFWHPKTALTTTLPCCFKKPVWWKLEHTNQLMTFLFFFQHFASKEFQHFCCVSSNMSKGFPQQPLWSRLCGVQRPHFWSSDFNGLPGPVAKGGWGDSGGYRAHENCQSHRVFSGPWLSCLLPFQVPARFERLLRSWELSWSSFASQDLESNLRQFINQSFEAGELFYQSMSSPKLVENWLNV